MGIKETLHWMVRSAMGLANHSAEITMSAEKAYYWLGLAFETWLSLFLGPLFACINCFWAWVIYPLSDRGKNLPRRCDFSPTPLTFVVITTRADEIPNSVMLHQPWLRLQTIYLGMKDENRRFKNVLQNYLDIISVCITWLYVCWFPSQIIRLPSSINDGSVLILTSFDKLTAAESWFNCAWRYTMQTCIKQGRRCKKNEKINGL